MTDGDNSRQEYNQGLGLGTVLAIIGAFIVGALVTANTSSIDINFIVYKAHNIPLWWYTLIVVALAIITDRILQFVMRHRKARRNKKKPQPTRWYEPSSRGSPPSSVATTPSSTSLRR